MFIPNISTNPEVFVTRELIIPIAVDFPAPFGPRIDTISHLYTLTEHELIISGPLPYPPVMLLPSKNAISNYL